MSNLINAKSDIFIRYLFGTEGNKSILIDFLNATFLDSNLRLIESVEVLNPFNFADEKSLKESVLDVKAKDECGRIINIEIQIFGNDYFINRSLYYWSKIYSSQLKSGESYTDLNPVICINILNFDLSNTSEKAHSCFYIFEKDDKELALTEDLEIHFFEIPKFLKNPNSLSNKISAWLEYLANEEEGRDMRFVIEKNPEIKKAHEHFEVFTSDDRVRSLHDAKIKSEFDRNSLIAIARIEGEEFGLQKGEKLGLQKGEKLGLQKGEKLGLQKGEKLGLKRGKLEERIEIAKVLKSLGDPVEKIMKVTGLTLEEIRELD